MIDHKSFLKSLTPEVNRQLTTRVNLPGILHLAGHLGSIVLLGAGVLLTGSLGWIFVLPLGIALTFLFTLEHETTHKTPFASERLNEWLGRSCGFVLILPFEWFRFFHLAHHKHTNILGKDPELEQPKPETWPVFLVHLTGVHYWRAVTGQLIVNARGNTLADYVPDRAKSRIQREAWAHIFVYALVGLSLLVSPVLLWIWVLPMLLGQPFLRAYLLAEHDGCAFVPNLFENTRTTLTGRIVRFLAWNMPYHAEHHIHPNVPFHKLPEFHAITQSYLRYKAKGYGEFLQEKLDALS